MSENRTRDRARDLADDERDEDFVRYVEDGVPMSREMTQDEATWVYLNLK